MSTQALLDSALPEGVPELTTLGKRLEILRIERGISKQHLARYAGTSRQQLWRVMTGKSELTSSLKERLAGALAVDPSLLSNVAGQPNTHTFALASTIGANGLDSSGDRGVPTIAEYLEDPQLLATTLRTLPTGDSGRRLKRALLNTLEDLAVEAAQALPLDYSEIRRRVLAGEL
jgi:transcriptional regulator with XRE-family HTH domain